MPTLIKKVNRKCANCMKDFFVPPCRLKIGGGNTCSRKCFHENFGKTHKEENHPRYNKENPSYHAVHRWLARNYGKASRCENLECKSKGKRYEYALMVGRTYMRLRDNFIMLCTSCHQKYDFKYQLVRQKRKDMHDTKPGRNEEYRHLMK